MKRCLFLLGMILSTGCTAELSGDLLDEEVGADCDDGLCDEGEYVEAYCRVDLTDGSRPEIETDYLPNLLACENNGAPETSLKAQAVAARSYVYYKMDRGEALEDSVEDQVYNCGRTPTAAQRQAVYDTRGIVLRYRGTQVAGFYVAGAQQEGPTCNGGTGHWTESRVTWNQGKSGSEVEQTALGWISPSNLANRGAMSQNGANCLSREGHSAGDIIRTYYGEDIEYVRAVGECI